MKEDILDAINDVYQHLGKEKAQAIMQSVDVIDCLAETASKFVFFFIATRPNEQSKILSCPPEELAIKAMQTALQQVANGGRQHGEQVH
jgi:hypothetical protein